MLSVQITIAPVRGGFVVSYPVLAPSGDIEAVQEIATTSGKAMRIARLAVEAFSLVKKDDESASE